MASKARRQKKQRSERADIHTPTPEQMSRATYRLEDVTDKGRDGRSITIGKGYRLRPMIDTLAEQGVFSQAEHKALKHYRHHADMAERSPIKDSLNKTIGGSGEGPSRSLVHAIRVRDDCERAAGSLRDILRAVVVQDISLSQWAIEKSGGIDDCTVKGGARVCRIKPRQKALAVAKLEIQIAAKRVQGELDA